MPVESPIALSARGYLPQTWDALANSSFYGESLLDSKQKFVKFVLFGTVVSTNSEDTIYNPLIIEYAAKALAITVIPAGADYYSNKLISITATGTNESKTWPDRIASLWLINARLLKEMKDLLPQVQQYLPGAGVQRVSSVARNTGAGKRLLSTDPQLFWPEDRIFSNYSATSWGHLPWSEWGVGTY